MSIYKGSRYEYSTVDYVSTKLNGPENPIVFYYLSSFSKVSYYEHNYVKGERLDQIAAKYYKNPGYWWVIPEFNPQIVDFTNIPEGAVIKVPRV
jgi:nucleoid-associated protein YgaU